MKNILHLKAPANWINDPNGFIYYKGQYHLFYQHFPYAPRWGTMHWGHAVSPDLIHWEHKDIALFPTKYEDQNGCFSGSAIEANGKLHIFYTGVHYNKPNPENIHECLDDDFDSAQMTIISDDGFHFDNLNNKKVVIPTITDTEIGDRTHTRDPKVWKGKDAWYIVLGSTTNTHQGEALFYKSFDLENWELAGKATTKEKFGWMWECPDLFEADGRQVFIFSPMKLLEDGKEYENNAVAMLVDFDEEKANMNFPENWQFLDYGLDLYAPQSTIDAKGRRVIIAWLRMPEAVDRKWNGMFCLPRLVEVKGEHIYFHVLPEIRAGFQKRIEDIDYTQNECYLIRTKLEEGESLCIGGFKIEKKNGKICTDRTRVFPCNTQCRLNAETPVLKEGNQLEIFVEQNLIEIYCNDGEYVLSQAVYGLGQELSFTTKQKPELYCFND